MKSILLIGRKNDPHIQKICQELKLLEEKFYVLDEFSSSDDLFIKFSNGFKTGSIKIDDVTIDIDEIKSVWNNSLKIKLDRKLMKKYLDFIKAEWMEGIKSLWNSTSSLWVNSPDSISKSSDKFHQIQIASKIGLDTPKTMITNKPDSVK